MNTSKLLAAAALSLLAVAGAHAETYDGVHAPVSANSRAQVQAEAVVAAHSDNPYAEGYNDGPATIVAGGRDRASVRAEAVAHAHRPNQTTRREAFANSTIPKELNNRNFVVPTAIRQAGL